MPLEHLLLSRYPSQRGPASVASSERAGEGFGYGCEVRVRGKSKDLWGKHGRSRLLFRYRGALRKAIAEGKNYPNPGATTRQEFGGGLAVQHLQRFRGGLVFEAHRLCVSLNSKRESNTQEKKSSTSVEPRTPGASLKV